MHYLLFRSIKNETIIGHPMVHYAIGQCKNLCVILCGGRNGSKLAVVNIDGEFHRMLRELRYMWAKTSIVEHYKRIGGIVTVER